jgi:hypothetical protein
MIRLLAPFVPLFSRRVWQNAQVLLMGAILTPGRRTGFETQRQWSEMAIRRTTPALFGLFSLVTLFAHQQMRQAAGALRRQAAWHQKAHPTFADALGLVRKELWAQEQTFYGLPADAETVKVPRAFVERLTDAVCYAA